MHLYDAKVLMFLGGGGSRLLNVTMSGLGVKEMD